MTVVLGCIADDFTGASDLASALVNAGMRTVQIIGVPERGWGQGRDGGAHVLAEVDAIVVALPTRTSAAARAVADSLAALAWLKGLGAQQIYFKYCSTFDSTDAGNIGPVADALLEALGSDFTVVCPAFPDNGRAVYQGHLFVGDRLLSESSMRHHPLTPMTDADLVRVLGKQTRHKVGLLPLPVVKAGPAAIRGEMELLRRRGLTYAVVDATSNEDLDSVAAACAGLSLVTAASGLARGLPANYRAAGLLSRPQRGAALPRVEGPAALLAGSCSEATRGQVAAWAANRPAVAIDPLAAVSGGDHESLARAALAQAERLSAASGGGAEQQQPILFYSSASPQDVAVVQNRLGRERAAALVESTFASLAVALVARGVRRLVIAGGETSGTVVKALNVKALAIGPPIAPGVPWTVTVGDLPRPPLALALKSGNFGGSDFFARALEMSP